MKRYHYLLIWLTALLFPLAAMAETINFDAGWEHRKIPFQRAVTWSPQGNHLLFEGTNATSVFLKRLTPRTGAIAAQLRWEIKVAPPPTRLDHHRHSDRALAVSFAFVSPGEVAAAQAADQVEDVFDLPSLKVVSYVWGGLPDAAGRLRSPFSPDNGLLVVVAPSVPGTGHLTLRPHQDIAAEFGHQARVLVATTIAVDTNSTGQTSAGAIVHFAIN